MLNRLLKATGLCIALLCGGSVFGQAGGYSFSVSTSTYTPLGSSATAVPILADTDSEDIQIGFDFEFEGTLYDTVSAASDGFISFVKGASSSFTNDLDAGSSVRRPLAAPLWDDLDGRANASDARYEITGTAPNRVFTMEWSNWEWRYNSTDSVVSFQVKLYETSNVIEFHYNWECSSCINSPSASIGLSGANSFLSVTDIETGSPTVSNATEDSNIDTVVTNQVLTFTPPACVAPSIAAAGSITSSGITINWTGTASAGYEINWDTTGFVQGASTSTTSTISSGTTFTASSLQPGTTYDFYIRSNCGSSYSAWVGPFTYTTAYVPPYFEDWSNGVPGEWTEAAGLIGNPTVFSSTSSSSWTSDGFSNAGTSGSARINIYGTSMDEWIMSPSIDLGSGSIAYQMEFDASLTPYSGTGTASLDPDDSVYVVISTDNGVTWNRADSLMTLTSSDVISNGSGDHYIIDLSAYTGVVKFAFYGESTVSGVDNNFYVDNFSIVEIPACPEPTNVSVSNITTSSVDLSWSSSGSGPWYIYWGPCGFDQASGNVFLDTATSQSTTITGLSTNTSYQFYLFEDCAAQGLSDTVDVGCTSTDCGVVGIPFTEGFNSNSTTEHCWTVLNANNDGDMWDLNYTSNAFDGDEVAMMYTDYNAGGNDDYLITPPMALSGNERLRFQYRVQSANEPNDFEILVSTTGLNEADFVDTLVPVASYGNTTYQEMVVDLSAFSSASYIAWHIPQGGLDGWRLYIDSVVVETIPPCVVSSSLVSNYVGIDSVQISWTPGGGATNYGVEFGLKGFVPGTGMTISTVDTFANIGGLAAGSSYQFYVYDTCATGYSVALGPININTYCTPVVAPYTENFDGSTWKVGSSSGANDTIDACWQRTSNTGYKWALYNGSTASSNTGPSGDHTGGGNFLYTESSSNSPSQTTLYTPYIDVSNLTQPFLTFWYHRYGTPANMGDMIVEAFDGQNWDTLLVQTGVTHNADSDPYLEANVVLLGYTGVIQLRITAVAKTTYQGDMAIDDFSITEAPTCWPLSPNLGVRNISDTSATMNWVTNTTASSYQVWYGPLGFYQGSTTNAGSKVVTVYDSLMVDTLNPLSCYEFLVRGICGPGDTSNWVGPMSFSTFGSMLSLPLTEGFENNTSYFKNLCDNSSMWLTENTIVSRGSKSVKMSYGPSEDNIFQLAGMVDLTTLTNPILVFDHIAALEGGFDEGYIEISTDGGTTYSALPDSAYRGSAADYPSELNFDEDDYPDWGTSTAPAQNNWWKTEVFLLDAYKQDSVIIRFRFSSDGSIQRDGWYLDNIQIINNPCGLSDSLKVDMVTTNSANISWNGVPSGHYNISYGVAGTFNPGGGSVMQYVSSTTAALTGLTSATTYEVYLQDTCSGGSGIWIGPLTFTTNCNAYTAPFYEGFDGVSIGNDLPVCWGDIATSASTIQIVSSTDHSATIPSPMNCVEMNDASTDYFISPEFSDLANGLNRLRIQIAYEGGGTTYNDTLFFGVMADQVTESSFVILDTIVLGSTTGAFGEYIYNFDDPTKLGANRFIAFKYTSGGGGYEFYFDDFNYEIIPLCPTPTNVAVGGMSCDSVVVSWTSDASATSSYIEYGAKGFGLGNGTVVPNVNSPYTLNGLAMDTEYDIYVVDSCTADQSNPSMVVTFETDSVGPVWASFTATQFATTLTDAMVSVDASASTGDGLTYSWDFGNSTSGNQMMDTATYTANGSQSIMLTVTDRCGNTDDTTIVVNIAGINIVENAYNASIGLYPNPNQGNFKVNVSQGSGMYAVEISDLSGKVIYRQDNLMPGQAHDVSLDQKANGVYLVRFIGEGLNVTQRLLID